MAMPKITLGCDPELFIRNNETNQFVSAWGMIPGDKHEPFKVDHGAIQVDGMAAEFNIDPVSNIGDWRKHIASVRHQLRVRLPLGHELVIEPTATFDPAYWMTLPPEAKRLGCDPDYNAYTGQQNPPPPADGLMRSGAGHIHIGWTDGKKDDDVDHFEDCIEVVKQMDYYIGVPSLVWDRDKNRRQLYGKAGAFRRKHYGVEYRTPSNQWLKDPILIDYVYNASIMAVRALFEGKAARQQLGKTWAQGCIDKNGRIDNHVRNLLIQLPYMADCNFDYLVQYCRDRFDDNKEFAWGGAKKIKPFFPNVNVGAGPVEEARRNLDQVLDAREAQLRAEMWNRGGMQRPMWEIRADDGEVE